MCLSAPSLMLPAHIKGPDRGAQIYGGQSIPDSPACSSFNQGGEGGGPESMIKLALIWTAQDRVLKSKVNIGFWDPPIHSAFNGRGGGGGGGPE
jgi:hypothetical protein